MFSFLGGSSKSSDPWSSSERLLKFPPEAYGAAWTAYNELPLCRSCRLIQRRLGPSGPRQVNLSTYAWYKGQPAIEAGRDQGCCLCRTMIDAITRYWDPWPGPFNNPLDVDDSGNMIGVATLNPYTFRMLHPLEMNIFVSIRRGGFYLRSVRLLLCVSPC